MASSKDPRNQRASLKDSSVESTSGMQPASPHRAVPAAHVTFLIDCATGKQVSLAAPTGPPQAPRANQGRITPPMKTFVMFCGTNTLPGRPLDGAKDNSPPCTGPGAPESLPASLPGPQNDPKVKGSSLKAGAPEKQSTREKVKHSLKALSCLCGPVE
ncbi:steroid receptor-associated and regulated protein [Apodemus sylvaticus]|uniref:steroid receptor-associated and regulated protein n=1 Tax=Apodemus sylvaticus TaxID=10129 RepID=UPI00224461E4|nr:steroid receptor-associated and regulated protein [Apodemus sylvaticus]XP_052033902.1 steroid receptor-associated and regulated protein [Apodemus sylvaticus]